MRIYYGIFTILFIVSRSAHAERCQPHLHNASQDMSHMKILTIFDDQNHCLARKAESIAVTPAGLQEAHDIVQALQVTLKPLMPAAGLAAPQISISKQVFIFSWDRNWDNMTVAINPKIISLGPEVSGWESCFSTVQKSGMSQAVYVTRAQNMVVEYMNLEGKIVRYQLEGFAAKVFQHEYDHLQAAVDTQKENAQVKDFTSEEELIDFMIKVKKEDSWGYVEPIEIS